MSHSNTNSIHSIGLKQLDRPILPPSQDKVHTVKSITSETSGITFSDVVNGPNNALEGQAELDIIKCIINREEYLRRLHKAVQTMQKKFKPEIADLLDIIRVATVDVVEAIVKWREKRNDHNAVFLWNEINYLLKMPSDLDYLDNYKLIRKWIGFSLLRNPFCVPFALETGKEIFAESVLNPRCITNDDELNGFMIGGLSNAKMQSKYTPKQFSISPKAKELQLLFSINNSELEANTNNINDTKSKKISSVSPYGDNKKLLSEQSNIKIAVGNTDLSQSLILNSDMTKIRLAELVVLKEEEKYGKCSRDPEGRLVPRIQAITSEAALELKKDDFRPLTSPANSNFRFAPHALKSDIGIAEESLMPVIQKDNVQMSSSDDEAISKRDIASILLGKAENTLVTPFKRGEAKIGGILIPIQPKGADFTRPRRPLIPNLAGRIDFNRDRSKRLLKKKLNDIHELKEKLRAAINKEEKLLADAGVKLSPIVSDGPSKDSIDSNRDRTIYYDKSSPLTVIAPMSPLTRKAGYFKTKKSSTAPSKIGFVSDENINLSKPASINEKLLSSDDSSTISDAKVLVETELSLDNNKKELKVLDMEDYQLKHRLKHINEDEKQINNLKKIQRQQDNTEKSRMIERKRRLLSYLQGQRKVPLNDDHVPNIYDYYAVRIQKTIRGWLSRLYTAWFREMSWISIIMIQKLLRGWLCRLKVHRNRLREKSAKQVQRMFRGWITRLRSTAQARNNDLAKSAVKIQKTWRGVLGKRRIRSKQMLDIKAGEALAAIDNSVLTAADIKELGRRIANAIETNSNSKYDPIEVVSFPPDEVLFALRLMLMIIQGARGAMGFATYDFINKRYFTDVDGESLTWMQAGKICDRCERLLHVLRALTYGPTSKPPRLLLFPNSATRLYQALLQNPRWILPTFENIGTGSKFASQVFIWLAALVDVSTRQTEFLDYIASSFPDWLPKLYSVQSKIRKNEFDELIYSRCIQVLEQQLDQYVNYERNTNEYYFLDNNDDKSLGDSTDYDDDSVDGVSKRQTPRSPKSPMSTKSKNLTSRPSISKMFTNSLESSNSVAEIRTSSTSTLMPFKISNNDPSIKPNAPNVSEETAANLSHFTKYLSKEVDELKKIVDNLNLAKFSLLEDEARLKKEQLTREQYSQLNIENKLIEMKIKYEELLSDYAKLSQFGSVNKSIDNRSEDDSRVSKQPNNISSNQQRLVDSRLEISNHKMLLEEMETQRKILAIQCEKNEERRRFPSGLPVSMKPLVYTVGEGKAFHTIAIAKAKSLLKSAGVKSSRFLPSDQLQLYSQIQDEESKLKVDQHQLYVSADNLRTSYDNKLEAYLMELLQADNIAKDQLVPTEKQLQEERFEDELQAQEDRQKKIQFLSDDVIEESKRQSEITQIRIRPIVIALNRDISAYSKRRIHQEVMTYMPGMFVLLDVSENHGFDRQAMQTILDAKKNIFMFVDVGLTRVTRGSFLEIMNMTLRALLPSPVLVLAVGSEFNQGMISKISHFNSSFSFTDLSPLAVSNFDMADNSSALIKYPNVSRKAPSRSSSAYGEMIQNFGRSQSRSSSVESFSRTTNMRSASAVDSEIISLKNSHQQKSHNNDILDDIDHNDILKNSYMSSNEDFINIIDENMVTASPQLMSAVYYGVSNEDLSILKDGDIKSCLDILGSITARLQTKESIRQMQELGQEVVPPSPTLVLVMEAFFLLLQSHQVAYHLLYHPISSSSTRYRHPDSTWSAATWKSSQKLLRQPQHMFDLLKLVKRGYHKVQEVPNAAGETDLMALLQCLSEYTHHSDWPGIHSEVRVTLHIINDMCLYVEMWSRCETLTLAGGGLPTNLPLNKLTSSYILSCTTVGDALDPEDTLLSINKDSHDGALSSIDQISHVARGADGWRGASVKIVRSALLDLRVVKHVLKIDGRMLTVSVYREADRLYLDTYDPSTSEIYLTFFPTDQIPALLAPNSWKLAKQSESLEKINLAKEFSVADAVDDTYIDNSSTLLENRLENSKLKVRVDVYENSPDILDKSIDNSMSGNSLNSTQSSTIKQNLSGNTSRTQLNSSSPNTASTILNSSIASPSSASTTKSNVQNALASKPVAPAISPTGILNASTVNSVTTPIHQFNPMSSDMTTSSIPEHVTSQMVFPSKFLENVLKQNNADSLELQESAKPPKTLEETYLRLCKLLKFETPQGGKVSGRMRKRLFCGRNYTFLERHNLKMDGYRVMLQCYEASLGELYFTVYIPDLSASLNVKLEFQHRLKLVENADADVEKPFFDKEDSRLMLHHIIDRLRISPGASMAKIQGLKKLKYSAYVHSLKTSKKSNLELTQGLKLCIRSNGGAGRMLCRRVLKVANVYHILVIRRCYDENLFRIILYEPIRQHTMECRLTAYQRRLLLKSDSENVMLWYDKLIKRLKLNWKTVIPESSVNIGGNDNFQDVKSSAGDSDRGDSMDNNTRNVTPEVKFNTKLMIDKRIISRIKKVDGKRLFMSIHVMSGNENNPVDIQLVDLITSVEYHQLFSKIDLIKLLHYIPMSKRVLNSNATRNGDESQRRGATTTLDTFDDQGNNVNSLLNSLAIPPPTSVGSATGNRLAVRSAMRSPNRVSSRNISPSGVISSDGFHDSDGDSVSGKSPKLRNNTTSKVPGSASARVTGSRSSLSSSKSRKQVSRQQSPSFKTLPGTAQSQGQNKRKSILQHPLPQDMPGIFGVKPFFEIYESYDDEDSETEVEKQGILQQEYNPAIFECSFESILADKQLLEIILSKLSKILKYRVLSADSLATSESPSDMSRKFFPFDTTVNPGAIYHYTGLLPFFMSFRTTMGVGCMVPTQFNESELIKIPTGESTSSSDEVVGSNDANQTLRQQQLIQSKRPNIVFDASLRTESRLKLPNSAIIKLPEVPSEQLLPPSISSSALSLVSPTSADSAIPSRPGPSSNISLTKLIQQIRRQLDVVIMEDELNKLAHQKSIATYEANLIAAKKLEDELATNSEGSLDVIINDGVNKTMNTLLSSLAGEKLIVEVKTRNNRRESMKKQNLIKNGEISNKTTSSSSKPQQVGALASDDTIANKDKLNVNEISLISGDGISVVDIDSALLSNDQKEIIYQGENSVFEGGVKVNFREGNVRWQGHVSIKIYETLCWTNFDGVGRRLRFVVYDPLVSGYFEGVIRNSRHLKQVLGPYAQDLLDSNKSVEMFLYICKNRMSLVKARQNVKFEELNTEIKSQYDDIKSILRDNSLIKMHRKEDKNSSLDLEKIMNLYTVEFECDRLFETDKITPINVGGLEDIRANQSKLIELEKDRGVKVLRLVRRVTGVLMQLTVFDVATSDNSELTQGQDIHEEDSNFMGERGHGQVPGLDLQGKNNISSMVLSLTAATAPGQTSGTKAYPPPAFRVIGYDPKSKRKSVCFVVPEAVAEVAGGTYSPFLMPNKRKELAKIVCDNMVLFYPRGTSNDFELLLRWSGSKRELISVDLAAFGGNNGIGLKSMAEKHLDSKSANTLDSGFKPTNRIYRSALKISNLECIVSVYSANNSLNDDNRLESPNSANDDNRVTVAATRVIHEQKEEFKSTQVQSAYQQPKPNSVLINVYVTKVSESSNLVITPQQQYERLSGRLLTDFPEGSLRATAIRRFCRYVGAYLEDDEHVIGKQNLKLNFQPVDKGYLTEYLTIEPVVTSSMLSGNTSNVASGLRPVGQPTAFIPLDAMGHVLHRCGRLLPNRDKKQPNKDCIVTIYTKSLSEHPEKGLVVKVYERGTPNYAVLHIGSHQLELICKNADEPELLRDMVDRRNELDEYSSKFIYDKTGSNSVQTTSRKETSHSDSKLSATTSGLILDPNSSRSIEDSDIHDLEKDFYSITTSLNVDDDKIEKVRKLVNYLIEVVLNDLGVRDTPDLKFVPYIRSSGHGSAPI